MASGFSWIEALRSLDWDFLQLPDLPDEFFFARLFSYIFVLHSLGSLLHIFADLISYLSVLSLLRSLSFCNFDGLTLDLFDNFFSILKFLLISGLPFF